MIFLQKNSVVNKASLLLALYFFGIASVFSQTNSSDLIYQLQQLQEEVRQLRGLVEQQAFELENIKRLQTDQYQELDGRLREVPQQLAVAPPVTDLPNGVSGAIVEEPSVFVDAPEIREPIVDDRQIGTLGEPPVNASAVTIEASPANEKAAYEEAFSALKDLRYADSARQFRTFVGSHPDSEYADNAQYWLGESYYAAGNYDLALKAFNDLLQNYPDSSKYADGLLKIGYTYYEQEQWPQARAALEQVSAQYPGTTLSRLAESRLRNMRLEGRF